MRNEILYTSVEQQLEKLKSQNLIILDENDAKEKLALFGYSNLIKSYRDPYIVVSNGKKIYRSGVTFDQICSLYILDKNLRNAVMASMQDLEEHIKEAAADVVAKSFGVHQDQYLQYKNYQNKNKRKRRFSLPAILDTMKASLDTDKEPIHHYFTKYGTVPPWILFKSIYFSTIINFIDLFKVPELDQMVTRIYNVEEIKLPLDSLRKLMMDALFICMDYRNRAAHGGRIYNYDSNNRLRTDEIFGLKQDMNICGFSKLLFLLNLFNYPNPFQRLDAALQNELTRHCSDFPQDVTYLGQVLNVNIVPKKVVYVSEKSNKYHFGPHCSGINNVHELSVEDAIEKGYVGCKRCTK